MRLRQARNMLSLATGFLESMESEANASSSSDQVFFFTFSVY